MTARVLDDAARAVPQHLADFLLAWQNEPPLLRRWARSTTSLALKSLYRDLAQRCETRVTRLAPTWVPLMEPAGAAKDPLQGRTSSTRPRLAGASADLPPPEADSELARLKWLLQSRLARLRIEGLPDAHGWRDEEEDESERITATVRDVLKHVC